MRTLLIKTSLVVLMAQTIVVLGDDNADGHANEHSAGVYSPSAASPPPPAFYHRDPSSKKISMDEFKEPARLCAAATAGDLHEVARLLQQHPEIVNMPHGGVRRTVLHCASASGHVEIVTLLLDHGATIDITSSFHYTPLLEASRDGHLDVVQVLVARGATTTSPPGGPMTPLMAASCHGRVEVVQYLLRLQAVRSTIDIKDDSGHTALHWVFCSNQLRRREVLRLLVAAGANPLVVHQEGGTPGDMARWLEDHESIASLQVGNNDFIIMVDFFMMILLR